MSLEAAPAAIAPTTQGLSFTKVLSIATGALGNVMQQQAQQQQANAQIAYQQQLAQQQAKQNYEQQVALRQEQAQEDESINRKRFEASLKERAAKSTALTASVGAGVSGISIDALMNEYDVQGSMYLEGLTRQQQINDAYTQQNVENIGKNVYIPAPVEQPSAMLPILGGVNSFLEMLGDTSSEQIRKSNLRKL